MAISITTRAGKGSPLNATEHDTNLQNIVSAIENTSTGHDHDGTDSKKVLTTNLDVTGLTAGKPLQVNSGGTAIESASDTGTGAIVRSTSPTITSPTLVTPALGTPASGDLQNCIGGIHYKTSTTLEGQDGKTITHNKGDTNYYVLVSPKDVVIPNVGDIWVVKSSNTAVVYNSGVSGISADISVIKTA